MLHRATRTVVILFAAGIIIFGAYYFANFIQGNQAAQQRLTEFGYLGAFILALLFGLSAIIPVPPGSFVPAFAAAGLSEVAIIFMLTLGTTAADSVGYYIGHYSHHYVQTHFPKTYHLGIKLRNKKSLYVYLFVFAYAAFVPLPNEAVVLTLGVIGYRLRTFILPLLLANFVHHAITAFGFTTLFGWLG